MDDPLKEEPSSVNSESTSNASATNIPTQAKKEKNEPDIKVESEAKESSIQWGEGVREAMRCHGLSEGSIQKLGEDGLISFEIIDKINVDNLMKDLQQTRLLNLPERTNLRTMIESRRNVTGPSVSDSTKSKANLMTKEHVADENLQSNTLGRSNSGEYSHG